MSSASLAIRRSSKTAKAASTNKGGGKQKGVKNYKQVGKYSLLLIFVNS